MKNTTFLLLMIFFNISFSQSLDATFGSNGGIIKNQISNLPSNDYATAAILQTDGKMIYAGGSYISRITTLGSLDTSFNSYGFKFLNTKIDALYLQNDGKILVAGLNKIYRLNTDGSTDTTFGLDGIVTVRLNEQYMHIKSIGLQTTGQIIMGGYIYNGTNDDFAVVSLNSNGSFDTSFDSDGIALLDIANENNEAVAMKIQDDGKIILCGQAYDSSIGMYHFATARFTTVGALDTTFGSTGYVITKLKVSTTNSATDQSKATAIDIQTDGKIVVSGYNAGTIITPYSSFGYLAVVRYTATGTLDTTFGVNGIVLSTKGYYTAPITTGLTPTINPKMIALANGKILISGGIHTFALYQLNSDGSFDTSFGSNGFSSHSFPNSDSIGYSSFLLLNSNNEIVTGGSNNINGISKIQTVIASSSTGAIVSENSFNIFQSFASIKDLIEEPDGKVVVGDEKTLAKYNVNGTIDTSFGINGIVTLPNLSLTKQQDGKILYVDTNNTQSIVRLNIDGTTDASFGTNGTVDFSTATTLIVNYIDKIVVAHDGKIYLCFDYNTPTSPYIYGYTYFGILRLNNDGTLDTTFGTNGYAGINFDHYATDETEWPEDLYEQTDGKLIITGHVEPFSNTTNIGKIGTVRLNNNGQVDTTFGINGKVISQVDTNACGIFIAKTLGDKYLINMNFNIDITTPNSITKTALLQLNNDGSIDTSFGTNGILTDTNYYDVKLQPDGKILRGTTINGQFGIYRNNTDGSLDTTFGNNGLLSTSINYYSGINKLLLLQDGNLLAGGYSFDGFSQASTLARYTNIALGTEKYSNEKKIFSIYPNPAKDHITIDFGTDENLNKYQIKITTVLGQEVYDTNITNKQTIIPITWTGKGLYFVSVYDSQNNLIETNKIIIR